MAKILHTGDIHLDSAFTGLSSDTAKQRRAGLRNLFAQIIDIANAEAVDALLLSGDIFDAYPIYPETEESFLLDLKRANMPVFITPGNHDPYTPSSPYKTLEFPENVHIFSTTKLTAVELPGSNLRIFGAAYTSEVFDERILQDFKVPDDDYINIVMLHSNLYTDGYSPISVNEIADSGADYVALAHVHKPTEILKAKSTHYSYCGCLECRDFGEAYDSGFYIGEITKESININRRKISDIVYREFSLDMEEIENIKVALPTPGNHEHLRLTLTGECEPVDVDTLYDELSSSYDELIITDRTTAPRDIWNGIEEDTLRGVFLQKMKNAIDKCTDEDEKQKLLLAAKYGIDAIENRDI